jgi:hypothetical protein
MYYYLSCWPFGVGSSNVDAAIGVDVDVALSISFSSFPALLLHMPAYPVPQSDHGRVPRN